MKVNRKNLWIGIDVRRNPCKILFSWFPLQGCKRTSRFDLTRVVNVYPVDHRRHGCVQNTKFETDGRWVGGPVDYLHPYIGNVKWSVDWRCLVRYVVPVCTRWRTCISDPTKEYKLNVGKKRYRVRVGLTSTAQEMTERGEKCTGFDETVKKIKTSTNNVTLDFVTKKKNLYLKRIHGFKAIFAALDWL